MAPSELTLEATQKLAAAQLADPAFYAKPEAAATARDYERRQKCLEEAYTEWERAQQELGAL